MKVAASLYLGMNQSQKLRIDYPSLVMALLRPGIGKEEMNPIHRAIRNHGLQNGMGITFDDADIS